MRELRQALLVFIVLSIVTGLAYPLFITGLAQTFFLKKANGSLIVVGGKVVGSELIGQKFSSPRYFHGRPSANDYDAGNSGGSNLGPANEKNLKEVAARIERVRTENGLAPEQAILADLVLTSASGLDPDISLDGALLQAARVAKARDLSVENVVDMVTSMAEPIHPGGLRRVNALKLNLALDHPKG
jgi:potassium-transporting ATPase KdpC subunit